MQLLTFYGMGRITDEIPGWRHTGRVDIEDFEDYLIRNRVLKESEVTDFNVNLFASRTLQNIDNDDDDLDL